MNDTSAAQILFDRLVITWIIPEAQKRIDKGELTTPFKLKTALIVWENLDEPQVWFNDEVDSKIIELQVEKVKPAQSERPDSPSPIHSLKKIQLVDTLRGSPFLFIIADYGKFFVLSSKMSQVVQILDFKVLREALATQGLYLAPNIDEFQVFLDSTRIGYDRLSSPASKRKKTIRLAEDLIESVKQTATARVQRHLRLPTLSVHQDAEFLPLLIEARQTYIDGYFFSCIASTATTADRICIRLSQHYDLPKKTQKWLLEHTLGQKIQKLRAERVITKEQESVLKEINRIRNRHIHPQKLPSVLTAKRDAFKSVTLLDKFLKSTFVDLYRNFTFEQGRGVPKPLV